jgi:hypothetical protein
MWYNLCTEMEIAEEDGGLRAGDHEDQEHQEQKSVPEHACIVIVFK